MDNVWTGISSKQIHEFCVQKEINTISNSENKIILGVSHRHDELNAIVNTILTTKKYINKTIIIFRTLQLEIQDIGLERSVNDSVQTNNNDK